MGETHGLWLLLSSRVRLPAISRSTPVPFSRDRKGVCTLARQRRAEGQKAAPSILPTGKGGSLRRHRCVPRACPKKGCAAEVSLESLEGTHRLERSLQTWGVRKDCTKDARSQCRGFYRQRPRQDFPRHRRLRRSEKTRIRADAPCSRKPLSEGGVLSGHELCSRLHTHSCWPLARCSQGRFLPSDPDDGEVPRELALLRWSTTSETAYVSVPAGAGEALSRCPSALLGQSDYCGAVLDEVDPHHVHSATSLCLCSSCLGLACLRRSSGNGVDRLGNGEVAKVQALAPGH
mmetsp:Transcript_85489/g.151238  ORF Transcript_85489/g.151238 Transcript_85489/m.151238 type:complete len:290 (+) Transcript_85489:178-1047(+)